MATPAGGAAQSSTGAGTFTLLLFASASSYAGVDSLTLPAPMALSRLFPALEDKFPGMTKQILNSCAVSVNMEYVDMPEDGQGDSNDAGAGQGEEVTLNVGDEVGIIPPVSSG